MKSQKLIWLAAVLAAQPAAFAEKGALVTPPPPPPQEPPPVYQTAPPPVAPPPSHPAYFYDQKPLGGRPGLVTPEQAQKIIDQFKAAYPKLGSPRFLIYVNRELVRESAGLKLIHRTERVTGERAENATGTNATAKFNSAVNNEYRADGKAEPTLADKQTVRDVERLVGRPLREAGASLTDQKVAAQLLADKPIADFVGSGETPEARKDREAAQKIADAVIEILISSKTTTVPTISGSQTITIPDIQVTAIRLSDSKILGQASSADLLRRVPPASHGNFDVNEVAEATALALMEDMTPGP